MIDDWRARLTARMEALGLTPAEVTRRAALKPSMMHDILKRGATPSVENLSRIATALGMTLGELVDGTQQRVNISPYGRVVGGGVVLQEASEDVDLPEFFSQDLVVLKVDTNFMTGAGYRPGDVVCGSKTSIERASNLVGLECIVCDTQEQLHIGILLRGASGDRWRLGPISQLQQPVDDIELLWAAPIRLIIRR